MNNISFDNPWLLFIAIPVVAAVLIPFCITVRRDNVNFHNVTSACLHIIIGICVTLAVAGMSFKTVITETDVYVLADISYSAEHNLQDVQKSVEQVSRKLPKNSKMGVICFGRNYQLLSELGGKVPDLGKADKVDRSATDIGSALRYAGNLFDDGVIKRIVVITDGAETVSSSNIVKVVSSMQEAGVYVDAVYIDDNLSPDTREVQIDGVEANASTYLNKQEEVTVMLRANCGGESRTDAYVTLTKNGIFEAKKTVSLYDGLNTVTMPLSTSHSGAFEYVVTVETVDPAGDFSPKNNTGYFTQKISSDKKVLYLGGTAADVDAGRMLYGDDGVTYITDPKKVPLTVEDMCVYDEIVMNNFDVSSIRAGNMFMTSLTSLVDNYGKTLTTYGDTFVENLKDGDKTSALKQLADLLPVRIGNYDMDKRLVAIVLDVSLSMNFESRFDLAKKMAIDLINSLSATDTVMVIGFSGVVDEFFPPSQLTQSKVLIEKINDKEAQNGTNLNAALTHTHNLMPKRFHDRRVIIISDGMDSSGAVSRAEIMTEDNIAVSAIGIFAPEEGDKVLNNIVFNSKLKDKPKLAEVVFCKNIKRASDADVALKDLTQEQGKIKIEGDSYGVTIARRGEAVADGVEEIAPLNGFWYNQAKSTAKVVLTAKYYRDKVTSFNVPVYAYWSGGGNGKVISFLSDITSDWTAGWTDGTGGGDFLKNIPVATLPDERISTPFAVTAQTEGGRTELKVITSQSLQNGGTFTATLVDPDGMVAKKSLSYASGEYFANFQTDAPGAYKVNLVYDFNGLHYEAETQFCVSYFAEYDGFTSYSKSSLYRLLTQNGKILDLDTDSIENTDSAYTSYVFDFTLPLMVACAVLFVADVIIRQLKWQDLTSFFSGMFRRRKA